MLETLAFVSIVSTCSWNKPGSNRYSQPAITALESYNLTKSQRDVLVEKMNRHQYDDLVTITKDSIAGKEEYEKLRLMHFGSGKVCGTPTREKWGRRVEKGLVYCAKDVCVLVPTVCNNVSLVSRIKKTAPSTGGVMTSSEPLAAGLPIEQISDVFVPDTRLLRVKEDESYFSLSAPSTMYGVYRPDPVYFPPGATQPLPESSTWIMFLLGFAISLWKRARVVD